MLNDNHGSDESISDNINIDNNDIYQKKLEKKFMQLYPTFVDDSSPKNNNNNFKFSNYSKEKKRTQRLSIKDERVKEELLDVDGTYKLNDLFLQLILKERCPLSKKKIYQTIEKYIKSSCLMKKIMKEMNSDNNDNIDNLCFSIAQNMSYVEYKKNKSIYKVGDKGLKLFLIIRGKVNIYKPVKITAKMSFKEYLMYCLLLYKHKEEYLLNKIITNYCKLIPIMFTEEITKAYNILFKIELNENIINKNIKNNKELKIFFYENEINFYDFGIDIKEIEKLLPERRKTKRGNNDGNKEIVATQEWEKYILKKCALSYGETSYFEKFDKIAKNKIFDIECYIYEFAGKVLEGNYFGDISIENDNNFIKNKREYSIFAEEDTIVGAIKNEDFIYIVAPNLKIERMKNLNFINEHFFFKSINGYIFAKNYFQYFIRHEKTRENIIFQCNTKPKSLFLVQEGNISLNVQCSIMQLNNIIEKLYIKLVTNKYYTEVLNKKFISKKVVNTIKEYANDRILKNLKLYNEQFIQEINKIRNFQISIVSTDEMIGLEELFYHIPYITNGIIISEKCAYYELPIDKLDYILNLESTVLELYIKISLNKLLSLIERLQNLKKSIVDFSKNKYDNYSNSKMNNNRYTLKTEYNNIDNNHNSFSFNNKENNNTNNSIEKAKMRDDKDNSNNKINTIDMEISTYTKINYKTTKRGFSSIKKQKINYSALENMKNEEKIDINNNSDDENNHIQNHIIDLQKRNMAKSAKKLTIKKRKYLYIEPINQKEREGSVDIFGLNTHNIKKNNKKVKDAMFIIDKYYTLDGIKKSIEKNQNKINMINKIYNNNNIKYYTVNKKEDKVNESQSEESEIKEKSNLNKDNNTTTIVQDEYNNNNLIYKHINLKLNIKDTFLKSKTINENKKNFIKNNYYDDNTVNKNRINLRKNIFQLNNIDINNKNNLIITDNYLFSSPSKLPKLNFGLNKNNYNINTSKNCASNSIIIDKMIEKTKKSIIPRIVKNFYDDKKNKGYIPFIANKKSNTLFLKKYKKKYDNNGINENTLHTEVKRKYLPKIYKYLPVNRSLSPND